MASNLIFQIAGDSTSRDHTPSSIGEYDDNDSFIDDGSPAGTPVGSPLQPVASNSPGLFCTPTVEGLSLGSDPHHRGGGRGGGVRVGPLDAYVNRAHDSAPVGFRYLESGRLSTPGGELRNLRPATPLGRVPGLRPHLPGGSPRLPSVSVGPSRPPTDLPKGRRGAHSKRKRVVESSTPSVHGQPSPRPSPSLVEGGGEQRECSPLSSASSEEFPLRQQHKQRRLSNASSVSSAASARSTFTVARSVQSDGRSAPGTPVTEPSSRDGSVAESESGESDAQSLDEGQDPDDDQHAAACFEFPSHLVYDDLEKVLSFPGRRLGSRRPRWASRWFMFTYSQSGSEWPYQEFINLVEPLGGKYHIGREQHADGGYHFHCYVDFERKFDFESVHRFCVGTNRKPVSPDEASGKKKRCPGHTHANILSVRRTPFHVWDYVQKYGVIVGSNCDRPPVRGPNTTRDDNYKGSLALETKAQFLEDIKNHSSRDYVLYRNNIHRTATDIYGRDRPGAARQDNSAMGLRIFWERYPAARIWLLKYFADPVPIIQATAAVDSYSEELRASDENFVLIRGPVKKRPRSLILHGGSRLGKTDFARALGAHCHFRGTFNLKTLMDVGTDNVDYIIWDDVPWSDDALKQERYKNWLGGQDFFTCTDRYLPKSDVTWNKPGIYLSNVDPLFGLGSRDQNWLRENCIIVDLGDKANVRSKAISEADCYADEF